MLVINIIFLITTEVGVTRSHALVSRQRDYAIVNRPYVRSVTFVYPDHILLNFLKIITQTIKGLS